MIYDTYRGVFNLDLLEGIVPSGPMGIPTVFRTDAVPSELIPFDKAVSSKDYGCWVHFFIHDAQFQRIWRDPWRYLPILGRFAGAIAPDFSVMWGYEPFVQFESICRSRMIASWLQRSGLDVLPVVRWGKEVTYPFAFEGIEPGGTVAVGTVGCMRDREARDVFLNGFPVMLDTVRPRTVVVYGSIRDEMADAADHAGVSLVQRQSATAQVFSHKGAE